MQQLARKFDLLQDLNTSANQPSIAKMPSVDRRSFSEGFRLQVAGFSIRDLMPVAFPHLRFTLFASRVS